MVKSNKTSANVSLDMNFNLNKLPVVLAVIIVVLVFVFVVWSIVGVETLISANAVEEEVVVINGAEVSVESVVSEIVVNINTSSLEALDALPGLGPVRAQSIIDYRRVNGDFLVVEDLLNVRGIGPETLEQIRGMVCV